MYLCWSLALLRGWRVPPVLLGWSVVAVATLLGPALVPLPNLTGTASVSTPLATLGGAVCGLLTLSLAHEPCPDVFSTAPSSAFVVHGVRILLGALTGPLIITAVGPSSGSVAMNVGMTIVGEGMLAAGLLGQRLAWLLPLFHLLAASTFGAVRGQGLHTWAWILSSRPGSGHLVVSATILAVGIIIWVARIRANSQLLEP